VPTPLITAGELRARLDAPDLRIVDARSGAAGTAAYRREHLRGAVHADLDRDLAAPAPHPERGGRHPLPDPRDFALRVGGWGISPETEVVAYDDEAGANAASRVWWMLRALGHPRVRVLEGGLAAARAAGLPITSDATLVAAAEPYPASAWQLRTADIDEVDAARHDPKRLVLDARAAFRYRGEREPIDPVAGHIPGARNAPFADALDEGGRFRRPDELRAHFATILRGVPPDRVIVHCGSGVTACHLLLALEHAGLEGAALYVGSWGEWCRQAERPRASGEETPGST
jgi:thiosulfate/3-mercaptopyruvate sulfurtransferase